MIKKLLCMGAMMLGALAMYAQTPLPLNPDVRHGQLPNGLNYYILHNEEPKERVNFYIAQKVGSTLETPEQLGLAHFLEHMAFNGTKNYPGKDMLNYLQKKGIRFGADINAYTGFDETVYNINNVPSTDKALMDSVLLVLFDWSGSILLEEDEINAERGVIEEEWRSRNSANQRMYEAMLPQIYSEYQYQQMPIGKMEVVKNFPPQAIRDYYHKWYRPDQQGIVIVGDMDAAEMEAKVKDLFSKIEMPANAAERTYPTVSDNKEPIYTYFQDKELQFPMVQVMFKSEKTPWEMRNTVEGYMSSAIVENLISTMINNRLQEYSQKPECKYAYAGVSFSDFLVSKTKYSFDVTIIAKADVKAAFDEAMAIVARACKTGFMESELVRARDEMLAGYEKAYNERNKTNSERLARELIRHFVDNEPSPGIQAEFELAKQVLPMILVQAINQGVANILTPENQVIIVSQPEKEGVQMISKETMTTALNNALNAKYEAYVDEVITDPLVEKLPKPGKIKSTANGKFGSTVYTLTNGATVIVKPTDYKADEIIMTAVKNGGKDTYAFDQAANVLLSSDAYSVSKLGKFDRVKLGKYLAGKNVNLGYSINRKVTELDGSSTVKDLPDLMELIYSTFTALNPDQAAYTAQTDQLKSFLSNMDKNPQYVFQKAVSKAQFNGNPLFAQADLTTVEKANYDQMIDMIKKSLANAADYTFIFTGNIDMAKFKPLMEQYIATLPSSKGKKTQVKAISPVTIATGIVKDDFKQMMEVPQTMVMNISSDTNVPYSIENSEMLSFMGDILDMRFTETLREEEGGTYSPYATASLNPYTGQWMTLYMFQTGEEKQAKIIKRAAEEMQALLKNGAKKDHFNKVKEAALKQLDIQERTNNYWSNALLANTLGVDIATNHRQAIEGITLDKLNNFMKNLYNGKNNIEVIMTGVKE